jgi:hypothetical protein
MLRVFTTDHLRRTSLWVVMAALLLAQTLGLLHRVVHVPHNVHAASGLFAVPLPAAMPTAHADIEDAGMAGLHWLDRLFASHDGEGCNSYDQLAHADFLWGHPAELCTQAANLAAPACNPAWHLAAQAAGYLARGPPALA